MSHEVETMAYANEVPWHGLGARVDSSVTIEEMQVAAGLDWNLVKVPMVYGEIGGETEAAKLAGKAVTERVAIVRDKDGKRMTFSSPSWNPMQPAEVLGFMRDYVAAGAATLETAGALRGGKVVWGLARLNQSFEVGRGDRLNGYLLLTAPNEVGKSITARLTTVRVVCANTMAMAERGGQPVYRQGHMMEFNEERAKAAIGEAKEGLQIAEKRAKTLAKLKISIEDATIKALAPVLTPDLKLEEMQEQEAIKFVLDRPALPKILQDVLASVENGPGQSEIAGTGWAVLNGVTHWADHAYGRNAATRMHQSWIGENGRRKLAVERKLLELAE